MCRSRHHTTPAVAPRARNAPAPSPVDETTPDRLTDRGTTPVAPPTRRVDEIICDLRLIITKDCRLISRITAVSFYTFLTAFTCLYTNCLSISTRKTAALCLLVAWCARADAYGNEFDKTDRLVENVNLDDIGAVFNKVAYGSTTKRSIPDTAYPVTTLATPLLTTYRYTDGYEEWRRVDTKKDAVKDVPRVGVFESEFGEPETGYGVDLEKDHALPTSAPAADILKNNHNKHYGNPNRYNNDRLKPDYTRNQNNQEEVTENYYKTTTTYNVQRNVRPTKSMYSKEIPRYVPPQRDRDLFTPPLPPKFQSPFQDKPTLRGTNNDFVHRRPIPPPSLMPNKDRIPFRPDLPKVNAERIPEKPIEQPKPYSNQNVPNENRAEKKKTLNTPSQTVRISDSFSGGRNVNESNFEYDKGYLPAITRILSGPNGRNDDFPDSLLQSVSATPNFQPKTTKTRAPVVLPTVRVQEVERTTQKMEKQPQRPSEEPSISYEKDVPPDRSESVTVQKNQQQPKQQDRKPPQNDLTTQITDVINLRNVKEKDRNVTFVTSDEVWLICWNVHIFLVLIGYIVLAIYSIYKLIRYENDPHMFSKSYFLTVHLMLTVICVLRIFYLAYDPYNVNNSFNVLLYDFLHNFPMSLMATTFAILILFLLKRTLTHLEVKTRPVFLVVFAALHIVLCLGLSILETFGFMEKASLIVCKPVFVLLAWALGVSYLYLYRIIKNVLAKKSQNLSEMCTQNISYASHITIAVALLFVLLGFVQLYALFFIEEDRFNGEIKHHWILWGFELSVRFIEISIITLLAIVVSLKMSQREKQTAGGFPLFPCTTSDSSTDNIYPNNCNTNPNAMNYSRNEMILDNLPAEAVERPILVKNAFPNDFDKKSTLERYHSDNERSSNFDRFERPKWGSDRFDSRSNADQVNINNFLQPGSGNFERGAQNSSARNERSSARKVYESAKYYTKPKYDLEYNNEDYQHDLFGNAQDRNIYSEPIDNSGLNHHQYERTRHEFERSDFDRRSRNSSNTSGRRSTGRSRKNHARPHLGIQTLPSHDARHQVPDSMLVDEQGFVRFRHMQEEHEKPKKNKKFNDANQYGEA